MVIRFDTRCPRCRKENSVFGFERICHDCKIRSFFKSQIKRNLEEQKITKEIRGMKPAIKEKMHQEILKELLEEEHREGKQ